MKKLVALIMSVVLFVSCVAVGASAAKDDVTPVIIVSGVGTRGFYMDYATENEIAAFPPEVDVPYVLLTAVTGITGAVLTNDITAFTKAVSLILDNIFDRFMCDENGNSKYSNVDTVYYPENIGEYDLDYTDDAPEIEIAGAVADVVGEKNTYFYNYDWRLDPCDNANELDKMIQKVKAQTSQPKVTLIPCSMGGAQTVAYLQKFGSEDIEKIIFMSSAHKGLLFVSELFSGQIEINQKDLFMFLAQCVNLGAESTDDLFDNVCSDLSTAKYLNGAFSFINDFTVSISDENVFGSLRRIFGRMPGMWAFVREEYFDSACEFMFDGTLSDELIQKINYYHQNVAIKADEILKQAENDGVSISICSHYDKGAIPLTAQACQEGDSLIETVCTSNGATVAKVGETLGEGYAQANLCGSHNHISADNKIDASTCLFPDSTWFIKGASHVGCYYGSEYSELIKWLVAEDSPNVYKNEKFPQFLQADNSQMTLKPVQAEVESNYLTLIIAVIKDIKNAIFN